MADNFDANISSANGLESTHALAILLTQPQPEEHINQQDSSTIKRLKKVKMSENILPDIPIHEYEGPKKPEMPLPLRVIVSQVIFKTHLSSEGIILALQENNVMLVKPAPRLYIYH